MPRGYLFLHDDGTMGEYAHLHQNGSLVSVGDTVQRGQQIGLSGNTGYSSGPHLHFAVVAVTDKAQQQSLPFLLKGRRGLTETPKQQYYYSMHDGQAMVPEVYADEMDFLEYFVRKSPLTDIHTLKDRVEFIDDHVLIYVQNGLRSSVRMDFDLNINGFESLRSESGKHTVAAKTEQLIAVLRPNGKARQRRYSYKYRYRELKN